MHRLRVFLVMSDTLLAEVLTATLGAHPQVQLAIHNAPHSFDILTEQLAQFAPNAVLLDEYPDDELLAYLAQHQTVIGVVRTQEGAIALYEPVQGLLQLSFHEAADLHGLLAILGRATGFRELLESNKDTGYHPAYGRITRLYPRPGAEADLEQLLEEYLRWLSLRPGFVLGLELTPQVEGRPLTRIVVWKSRGWADATALSDHALATRSRLIALTKDQTIHEEELTVRLIAAPAGPLRAMLENAPLTEAD